MADFLPTYEESGEKLSNVCENVGVARYEVNVRMTLSLTH